MTMVQQSLPGTASLGEVRADRLHQAMLDGEPRHRMDLMRMADLNLKEFEEALATLRDERRDGMVPLAFPEEGEWRYKWTAGIDDDVAVAVCNIEWAIKHIQTRVTRKQGEVEQFSENTEPKSKHRRLYRRILRQFENMQNVLTDINEVMDEIAEAESRE